MSLVEMSDYSEKVRTGSVTLLVDHSNPNETVEYLHSSKSLH